MEKTYWLEGGIVGGMALGLLAMPLAGMSDSSRPTAAESALAFMMGASVGFAVGALVGGQFRKHE
jgi:O-antigen ligase